MKKYFLFAGIILIISGLIFALIKFQPAQKKPADQQKIIVLLDWFPNTNHTGLYVAKENGYFADENLLVTIIQPSEGETSTLVAAGKADFAISSQESVTLARVQKIPIVSISAIIQHNTSAFASLAESNIRTVKDFENKRYGGWGSPIENATIKAVMDDANADYSKVTNITIGTTDFFTTIGRDSDFQWIFYGWDGIEAQRRKKPLNTILLKNLNPILDYYTPVIITNEQHINSQKDLVRKFMRAVSKGYQFAIANPDKSADILIKNAPELNKDLVKKSQVWLSKEYQAKSPVWGIQKKEVWKGYADWLFEHGLMEKNIDTQKAFTNEFLPQNKL